MTSLLPPEFNTVTLVGQYVNLDGTPVAGYLTFTPSPTILRAAASKDIIVPVTLNVPLDGTGNFSVALPATDDPDINPANWTYAVLEGFGNRRQYSVQILLENGATQNIFDLAPVAQANGTFYTLGPTGPAGPPALIVSGVPSSTVGGTGDYAIDPVAGILYGPKTQLSGWGSGLHLAAADIAAHAALARSHGVQAGSVLVGTTDTQTLSNKTLAAPTITGGITMSAATITGAASVGGNLSVTGDVSAHNVTGNIGAFAEVTVSGAPTNASDAVRKDYVDTLGTDAATPGAIVRRDSSGAISVSAISVTSLNPTQNTDLVNKGYVDANGPVATLVNAATSSGGNSTLMKRDATNGVSVGSVFLGNAPSAANHATRKDYVDAADALAEKTANKGAAGGYAGLDATSGLLVPKYEEYTQQASAPAVPAAGKTRLFVDTSGLLQLLPPTGTPQRRIPLDWGSGTALPSTGMVVGDTYQHTALGRFAYGSGGWQQIALANAATASARATLATTYASSLYTGLRVRQTDTGNVWEWNATSSKWIAVPDHTFPVMQARQTTTQTGLTSAWTNITLQTTDVDSHSAFASNAFTVPAGQDGTYELFGSVYAAGGFTGLINGRLTKNGTAISGSAGSGAPPGTGGGQAGQTNKIIVSLVAGDVIGLQGTSGGTWATAVFSDGSSALNVLRIR